MPEFRTTLERARRRFPAPELTFENILRRGERKRRNQRISAGVVGIAILLAGLTVWGVIRSTSPTVPLVLPQIRATHNGPITVASRGITEIDDETGSRLGTIVPCPAECDTGSISSVAWSPDGSQIAFVWTCHITCSSGAYGVYVASPASGTSDRIATGIDLDQVVWSQDGTRLAYVVNGQIVTADPDGSDAAPVAIGDHRVASITWSPDGDSFAFKDIHQDAIYVVDAAGGDPWILVKGSGPAWSPDGATLAFRIDCSLFTITPERGNKPETVVDDLDLLAVGSLASCATDMPLGQVAWAPDGSALVTSVQTPDTDGDVIVVPLDGSPPRPLKDADVRDDIVAVSWRPVA